LSVDAVLPILLVNVHFEENQLDRLLVDLYLSLGDHIVDQSDEGSKAVVVLTSESEHSGLKLVLLLLKHHGLVLVGLTHLGVFHILLLAERPAL